MKKKINDWFILGLYTILLFLFGLHIGKQTEIDRLSELDLYPSQEEILNAENYMFNTQYPSFIDTPSKR